MRCSVSSLFFLIVPWFYVRKIFKIPRILPQFIGIAWHQLLKSPAEVGVKLISCFFTKMLDREIRHFHNATTCFYTQAVLAVFINRVSCNFWKQPLQLKLIHSGQPAEFRCRDGLLQIAINNLPGKMNGGPVALPYLPFIRIKAGCFFYYVTVVVFHLFMKRSFSGTLCDIDVIHMVEDLPHVCIHKINRTNKLLWQTRRRFTQQMV